MLATASASSRCSARALRPADHHHHHPSNQFVGNRPQATYLANKVKALKSDDEIDKQLKVFSIVGFNGLGRLRSQWRSVGS
jgi:disease resistance protein RPM1